MILFCTEKWCSANPSYGLTNNFHNLFNTFSQSRSETYDTIHLDECNLSFGVNIDKALLHYVSNNRVEMIVFSLLGESDLNPSEDTYTKLKQAGIKLVFMWPDTSDWAIRNIMSLRDIADINISWDNATSDKHSNIIFPDNHRFLWVPQDNEMFRPVEQTIPVSFVGSIYPDRHQALSQSKSAILIAGGQRGTKLTPYQYAHIVRSSKIGINFSMSPCQTYWQTKGRVYEILASRSMLLEYKNPATSKYLSPGQDYIEFSSASELDDAIQYFSNNEEARTLVATRGYITYTERYTAFKFWSAICN